MMKGFVWELFKQVDKDGNNRADEAVDQGRPKDVSQTCHFLESCFL